MATKKLRRAGLSQELCDRLSRHQIITCRDFLCLSLLELMKVTGKSYWNVQKLLCKVSLACAPKMQTAYEMKMKTAINPSSAFLSTTLNGLDKALHGGVACGSLTERGALISTGSDVVPNPKRAPAWTVWEILDLIAVWGDKSVPSELRYRRRNAKVFEKNLQATQCCVTNVTESQRIKWTLMEGGRGY